MARRVRQASSRGSKKRASPGLPDDVIVLAERASLSEVAAPAYSGGDETLVLADDVTSEVVYGGAMPTLGRQRMPSNRASMT